MIHDFHGIVDFVEGMIELSLCNDERRCNVKDWRADPHEDTVFVKLLLEGND